VRLLEAGSRSSEVSMPSVRAMRLARSARGRGDPGAAGFNALGAGDEARETLTLGFDELGEAFQCPRCGR